jgi:hypothetical protein
MRECGDQSGPKPSTPCEIFGITHLYWGFGAYQTSAAAPPGSHDCHFWWWKSGSARHPWQRNSHVKAPLSCQPHPSESTPHQTSSTDRHTYSKLDHNLRSYTKHCNDLVIKTSYRASNNMSRSQHDRAMASSPRIHYPPPQTTPSALLQLPRELRDIIYSHFFTRPGHGISRSSPEHTKDEINLRMTCHQVLHETTDALYIHNTVTIRFIIDNPIHLTSGSKFAIDLPSTAIRSLLLFSHYYHNRKCGCHGPGWSGVHTSATCWVPECVSEENLGFKGRLPRLKEVKLLFKQGLRATDCEQRVAKRRVEAWRVLVEEWNQGCSVTASVWIV